jgi:anaerobic ribonucleoside-triphosphate reductase activating protein
MADTNIARVSGVINESVVDGPGLRIAVFLQGCPHHCPGCHNPGTHDPNGGRDMRIDEIAAMMDADPLLSGVTLSGGEPFEQTAACARIAAEANARGMNVWCYTGYTWEQIMEDVHKRKLLPWLDVLVDGRFVQELRTLELPWRGSSNQRIIDVQASLTAGRIVEWEPN